MGNLECAICKRYKSESSMTTFTTTVKDREAMKGMGEKNPKGQYHYCRTCISIVSNPVTSLSLMKGLIQIEARAQGINAEVAEKAAGKFASRLLERSRKTH